MANIHAFGDCCPNARKIIHLGVTSAFVGDNTRFNTNKRSFNINKKKISSIIDRISKFALEYKNSNFTYIHISKSTINYCR